jgi:hypothetical protein
MVDSFLRGVERCPRKGKATAAIAATKAARRIAGTTTNVPSAQRIAPSAGRVGRATVLSRGTRARTPAEAARSRAWDPEDKGAAGTTTVKRRFPSEPMEAESPLRGSAFITWGAGEARLAIA